MQGASELFHRLYPSTHHLGAPLVEELSRPRGRFIVPELLEVLLEQIGTHAFEVVVQEIAQPDALWSERFSLRLSRHQRVFFSTGP